LKVQPAKNAGVERRVAARREAGRSDGTGGTRVALDDLDDVASVGAEVLTGQVEVEGRGEVVFR
jgi:hypothetical protein